jgi:serine/threonine-protein kinase
MSVVYKGRQVSLGRLVAIKVLLASLARQPNFRHRFEREARVVASLRHSNIVQLFDYGESNSIYYMVMEYLGGQTLGDQLRASGAMPIPQACTIIAELAEALDYAHLQGVVHRDVKPSNVMLAPVTASGGADQRAVLMDFGIARMAGGVTNITNTGLIGTFDYMAPEQIRDAKDVDGRADIYSLGVMAFQMLTGKLPFSASNPSAVLIAHMQQPAPDPRTLRPDLPDNVARAILKALEKDPVKRFTTAGLMAKDIV